MRASFQQHPSSVRYFTHGGLRYQGTASPDIDAFAFSIFTASNFHWLSRNANASGPFDVDRLIFDGAKS